MPGPPVSVPAGQALAAARAPVLGSRPACWPVGESSPPLRDAPLGRSGGVSRLRRCGGRDPAPRLRLGTGSKHHGHPETGSAGLERSLVTRIFGKASEVPKV